MKKTIFFFSFFLSFYIVTKNASAISFSCSIKIPSNVNSSSVFEAILTAPLLEVLNPLPGGGYDKTHATYNLTIDSSSVSEYKTSETPLIAFNKHYNIGPLQPGKHTLKANLVSCLAVVGKVIKCEQECTQTFLVNCADPTSPSCPKKDLNQVDWSTSKSDACKSLIGKPEYADCNQCATDGKPPEYGPGSWSALGCIPTGPEKFIQWLLNNAINIVGGLAFLMILFGSFKVATSSGNPESLNEGKEIIFAALAGLLFIVFSVILLKIIGHDILQIPGFQ